MGDHIDVNDEHQLRDLANRLHLSIEQIVKLANEVGPDTDHIHDVLKKRELENNGGRILPTTDEPAEAGR